MFFCDFSSFFGSCKGAKTLEDWKQLQSSTIFVKNHSNLSIYRRQRTSDKNTNLENHKINWCNETYNSSQKKYVFWKCCFFVEMPLTHGSCVGWKHVQNQQNRAKDTSWFLRNQQIQSAAGFLQQSAYFEIFWFFVDP